MYNICRKYKIMKTKFFTLLLSVILLSCNGDKKKESLDLTNQVEKEDTFNVTLDVVVKKEDVLHMYYTTDTATNFGDKAPISIGVKGSEASQKVVFQIPEVDLPKVLRFDVGNNLDQDEIIINSITLEYLGKTRSFVGKEMAFFFRVDESNCDCDIEKGLIKGKVVDGKRSTPLIYPHDQNLSAEIDKLIKQK